MHTVFKLRPAAVLGWLGACTQAQDRLLAQQLDCRSLAKSEAQAANDETLC